MRRLVGALALVALVCGPARADERPAWRPEKTWAFVASVIAWPDKGLAPFTDRRRDEDLVRQLQADGVPEDHVVFLKDAQATLEAMRRDLAGLAQRAGEGSTLVFYFQGHGLHKKGRTFFACYDVDTTNAERTAFGVDEIEPILAGTWKGDRLLLLGDCCHAGALASVVEAFEKRGLRAACLSSATASNRSTEHWTFTEAVIAGLRGDGRLDRDHDGAVTFAEVDRWVHDEMKFREGQLTRATRTATFEEGFVVRPVPAGSVVPAAPGPWQPGDYVDALDQLGQWYVSQVLAVKDGRYRVHYVGWDEKWDEWVGPEKVRPLRRPALEVGRHYEVLWQKDDWYPATVVKVEEGWFYFVHYEGEEGEDDEWITQDRAREPKGRPAPAFLPLAPRPLAVGDAVVARWRREWYVAAITAIDGEVHVVLYGDGDKGRLRLEDLIPVARPGEVEVGERVLACWDGKPRAWPGVVSAKGERSVTVRWEDGSAPSEVPFTQVGRIRNASPK